MRRIQTFIAMVLLVSLFLIFFYSTLHLETSYSHKAGSEDLLVHDSPQGHDRDVKTQNSKQRSLMTPLPKAVNVSDNLRHTITQNGAYWNRLLYLALRNLEKGENPFTQDSGWSNCRQTNPDLLQTNIHDFSSYPFLFQDFLQGMTCRSPPGIINQPNKCIEKGDNQTFLLFAIKSSPGNFDRRQAVRETWGWEGAHQSGLRVRTVFLLGSSQMDDPDLSALLSFEAGHFGDLLQWDFHESFLNLTLKMNAFLQWTLKYCPRVSFVFSGDDDVFVNTPALLGYLLSLDASKASQLYAGHVISTAGPLRDPKSKYYIPLSFYDGPYAAYAGGGGFVISGSLLQPLYSVSQVIPFFPIDDVYIGMCSKAVGVSAVAHTGFQTFDVKEQDRENLCIHKDLILIHQRSPQQMKKLWNGIHSPFLTC